MIDQKDRQIVHLLQENARLSNAEIGEQVGLTASSVYERVRKLQEKGVIKGYVAIVDPEALGKPLAAFVRVTVGAPMGESYAACKRDFIEACRAESEVLECHGVAGEDCYILKVRVAEPSALEALLDRLRSQAAVASSVSNIVLSTIKESTLVEPVAFE
jgi:Lrp/AsnC family leucine-responsive transcriptional regulator